MRPILKDNFLIQFQEEMQSLLRTSEKSPIRTSPKMLSGSPERPNFCSDSEQSKLIQKQFFSTTLPPPAGYNQGYFPIPVTPSRTSSDGCECNIRLTESPPRIFNNQFSPVAPASYSTSSSTSWQSQQQQLIQLARCGYDTTNSTLPNLQPRHFEDRPRLLPPDLVRFQSHVLHNPAFIPSNSPEPVTEVNSQQISMESAQQMVMCHTLKRSLGNSITFNRESSSSDSKNKSESSV